MSDDRIIEGNIVDPNTVVLDGEVEESPEVELSELDMFMARSLFPDHVFHMVIRAYE
jgi:hypothetical protein